MIINWAKGESTLAMVNLEAWCNNTKNMISSFTYVDFSHVYREYNKRADTLSKAGLNEVSDHLTFTEICEGERLEEVRVQLFCEHCSNMPKACRSSVFLVFTHIYEIYFLLIIHVF